MHSIISVIFPEHNQLLPPKESATSNFNKFVDHMFEYLSALTTINIVCIADQYYIEKRRLYDLFNFLVSLDICRRTSSHNYIWQGISGLNTVIYNICLTTETEIAHNGAKTFFDVGASPTIGTLTHKLLGAFLFFGQNELSIKKLANLFVHDHGNIKPLLRRLYLVTFFLEKIGLMKHSELIGFYQLNYDADQIRIKVLETMRDKGLFGANTFEATLSRLDKGFLKAISTDRFEYFEAMINTQSHE